MEIFKTETTKSYSFLFNTRHPCLPLRLCTMSLPHLVVNRPLLTIRSHLALWAPGPVRVGMSQRGFLLWAKFEVGGSSTDFPFSSESVTFKKYDKLENVI